MTGYTVHTGTSKKFISGWDRVFSSKADTKAGGVSDPKSANSSKKKKKK
ncbi:MAG: hypothetical protein WCO86_02045 [Planctomycetota bacterium]